MQSADARASRVIIAGAGMRRNLLASMCAAKTHFTGVWCWCTGRALGRFAVVDGKCRSVLWLPPGYHALVRQRRFLAVSISGHQHLQFHAAPKQFR
jgi:hypothetical protein